MTQQGQQAPVPPSFAHTRAPPHHFRNIFPRPRNRARLPTFIARTEEG